MCVSARTYPRTAAGRRAGAPHALRVLGSAAAYPAHGPQLSALPGGAHAAGIWRPGPGLCAGGNGAALACFGRHGGHLHRTDAGRHRSFQFGFRLAGRSLRAQIVFGDGGPRRRAGLRPCGVGAGLDVELRYVCAAGLWHWRAGSFRNFGGAGARRCWRAQHVHWVVEHMRGCGCSRSAAARRGLGCAGLRRCVCGWRGLQPTGVAGSLVPPRRRPRATAATSARWCWYADGRRRWAGTRRGSQSPP